MSDDTDLFSTFLLSELDQQVHWFFAPFMQITISEPAALGPMVLTRLDWMSWRFLERTELVEEYILPQTDQEAVVGIFTSASNPSRDDDWSEAEQICEAATIALRLAGDTNFVEPRLVGLYSKYGSTYARRPGHYRQDMLQQHLQPEHKLKPAIIVDAHQNYEAVQTLLTRGTQAELLSLELFRDSFGPYLGSGDRLLFLFASLEALFLPWRERVTGVTLERRAALAAALGGTSFPATLEDGAARKARNQLAHGEPDEIAFASLVAPMQEMMRGALRCWLKFQNTASQTHEPVREFNSRLALSVRNNEAAGEASDRLNA